jgi:hypothetical protein
VGNVVESYDNDKKFPVVGFGAITKENFATRQVNHCLSLVPTSDGLATGIKGVLDAYQSIFSYGIKLYGPTMFSYFLHNLIS